MKKYIVIVITLIIMFIVGGTFANDCGSVKTLETEGYWDNYTDIMEEEAFKKATSNLKKFCCSEEKDLEYCVDTITGGDYPASAYLFDHLLDVYIRRLDAKEISKNGENLIYNLQPDVDGKEWRNFITKHANNHIGSIPLEIAETYKKTREIREQNLLTRWTTNNNTIPWVKKDFDGFDSWNLGEKYNGTCEIITYIYMSKRGLKINQTIYKAYEKCKNLISQRIENEYIYTEAILSKNGNNLLIMNINNYLNKMFVQDKMTSLQKLISEIKGLFLEIVNSARLCRECS